VVLMHASRVPILGRLLSIAFTLGLLAVLALLIGQHVQFDPLFGRVADKLHLDGDQRVVGRTMRVAMSPDGHFWVDARVDGLRRRMLVDSGATVTALSVDTAAQAGLDPSGTAFPMIVRTANGSVAAKTAVVRELRIGNVVARDVPVVVSPAFGDMDVVGMNLLGRLKSWRVEGRTLVLEPHHPDPKAAA
jgi:aspartyl protease family protein